MTRETIMPGSSTQTLFAERYIHPRGSGILDPARCINPDNLNMCQYFHFLLLKLLTKGLPTVELTIDTNQV